MSNDSYPSTRGMTDAEVTARQIASRRVTVSVRRPYLYGTLPLVTTPTSLRPTPRAWRGRLS